MWRKTLLFRFTVKVIKDTELPLVDVEAQGFSVLLYFLVRGIKVCLYPMVMAQLITQGVKKG